MRGTCQKEGKEEGHSLRKSVGVLCLCVSTVCVVCSYVCACVCVCAEG